MTEELQKCISGRTEEGFLAGEPARGLGASRRPSGDVRFTGFPARYGARTFGRCFASTRHHRKNIAVQSHTKVSTLVSAQQGTIISSSANLYTMLLGQDAAQRT